MDLAVAVDDLNQAAHSADVSTFGYNESESQNNDQLGFSSAILTASFNARIHEAFMDVAKARRHRHRDVTIQVLMASAATRYCYV